jgi:hypothetical protein
MRVAVRYRRKTTTVYRKHPTNLGNMSKNMSLTPLRTKSPPRPSSRSPGPYARFCGPQAALRDSHLYEFLALVDAIRDGRARERKIAERELVHRLLMGNSNFQLLVDAAKLLKPILGERVFVAGCTTGLLITDKAAADVRSPYDVDAMAEITSYVGYSEFSERLKALGFREDTREGPPLCRWCQQTTTLDVMPLDGKILGFKNTWYGPAMETAKEHELEPGLMILMVNPVYFCASKLADLASQERITTVMGRPKKIASLS